MKTKKKNNRTISILKKDKLFLIVFLVVIVALTVGIIISLRFDKEKIQIAKNENENGLVANTRKDVIKDEKYEGLEFTNISLISENGYSTFTADVTNVSQTDSTISDVDIILQDKNGNEVITLRGNIGEPLKPNETRTITAVTKGNLKNVTAKAIAKYKNTAN